MSSILVNSTEHKKHPGARPSNSSAKTNPRRRLRKYLKSLADLTQRKRPLKSDDLHQALGAAQKAAVRDARHVKVKVTLQGEGKDQTATLSYQIDRQKLREARRREGRYLLRTNLTDTTLSPAISAKFAHHR